MVRIVGAAGAAPRVLRFAALLGAVLLAHALALWSDGERAAPAAPRAAMIVATAPSAPVPVPARDIVVPEAPPPAEAPRAVRRPRVAAPVPAATAAPAAPEPVPAQQLPAQAVVPVAAIASDAAASPPGVEVPIYATRLPPAVHWAYELRRGFLSGRGDLVWSPQGRRYEARLEGRVASFNILDWSSRGAIDGAGAAPERFVIRRRGKEALAANFQREAGKITYSGPETEHPLPMGTQDRLSLLLQLSGIVAADPQRFSKTDAHIVVFVSGARGDADVWTFDIVGSERVDTVLGPVQALHLRREPRSAHDTLLDVWLDPLRHHLPVRASLANAGGGEALELLLMDESPSS